MPLEGELSYYQSIGEDGIRHALNKPFSQPDCDMALMQIGAVMSLLPQPPARVLDCGCGVGWLTRILAQRGYECVGVDVSPHAVRLARTESLARGMNLRFETAAMEDLPFEREFDVVLFYDALHHSLDEENTIACAYRALKPGGVCLTSEPGNGHHDSAAEVVAQYNVTEKDMPMKRIIEIAQTTGFTNCETFPRMDAIGRKLYHERGARRWWQRLVRATWLTNLLRVGIGVSRLRWQFDYGIVLLHKPVDAREERQ